MISRSRTRSRSTEDQSYQSFLLTDRVSKNHLWEEEFHRDINPDSDAAFLRRHQSIDRENCQSEDQVAKRGLLQRVFTFMSDSLLLGASSPKQAAASYGALRNQSSRSEFGDWDSADDDDIRKRGRRNGRRNAARPAASSASFGSQRRMGESASISSSRLRRVSSRESSPMLIAESGLPAGPGGHLGGGVPFAASSEDEDEGDEVISIDEDGGLDPPDNSPYPQVRASVAATDDISASINTPRMWILSLLCALLGSATNLFFSLRYPSVAITPVIALVTVHPLGRAWDRLLKLPNDPVEDFEFGNRVRAVKRQDTGFSWSRMSRLRLWLAQGRWNGKEHACVSKSRELGSLLGTIWATNCVGIIRILLLHPSDRFHGSNSRSYADSQTL